MRRSSQGKSSCSNSGAGLHKYDLYGASNARTLLTCYTKTKPRPSKWDDAQKWLSRAPDDDGRRRSSSADVRLLLPSVSQKGNRLSWSNADGDVPAVLAAVFGSQEEEEAGETKRVDSVQAYERQRCVSLRDAGTEMTPGGSKEPSRTNTPRAALAAAPAAVQVVRAPDSPGQRDGGSQGRGATDLESAEGRQEAAGARTAVSPATAWDEAERAKYMARYRREEMKIQAWENRQRRKAELQMKMTEIKAERMKLRAQEKAAGKLATAQTLAKEKRAGAEAELNRRVASVRGKGVLLRRSRSWHSPSSLFSFKLPLLCS